jgi:hypothetical protein
VEGIVETAENEEEGRQREAKRTGSTSLGHANKAGNISYYRRWAALGKIIGQVGHDQRIQDVGDFLVSSFEIGIRMDGHLESKLAVLVPLAVGIWITF